MAEQKVRDLLSDGDICSENNFFPDVTGDGMADAVVVNVPNPVCIN